MPKPEHGHKITMSERNQKQRVDFFATRTMFDNVAETGNCSNRLGTCLIAGETSKVQEPGVIPEQGVHTEGFLRVRVKLDRRVHFGFLFFCL